MEAKRWFASDNNAGVHPEIFRALRSVSKGHAIAYGDDEYTKSAMTMFRQRFGSRAEPFFVFGGTGANVVGLATLVSPFNGIICAESAHISADECTAVENFTGCKLLSVPTRDGKLVISQIADKLLGTGDQHHVQPKAISISQPTELGTVYYREEVKAIADFAHQHGLWLHMDGARLANAAMYLNLELNDISGKVGVDVLSFGGTKNGMMFGEAVIFFNPTLAANFRYIRKMGMQLPSKMRFISEQFLTLLNGDFWKINAEHANTMAQYLELQLREIPQIRITQKVQSNAVFAAVPGELIMPLQKEYFFYIWNERQNEVRWMTSWDTTTEDIDGFISYIKKNLAK